MDLKRRKISSLESSDPSYDILTNVIKFIYTFPIRDFPLYIRKTGKGIKSTTLVYPNGETEESKDYVSVSLVLGKPSKAEAIYRFSILNDKEKEENVSDSCGSKEFVKNKSWGFSKFIKKDFLLDKSNGLLNNDTLTIICELSVVNESWNYQRRKMLIKEMVPQSRLSFDLSFMLNSSSLTDCTLKVRNSEIRVHKVVLAARSCVFYDIFNSTSKKSQPDVIEIKDFHVGAVKEMLKYIYTDEVSDIQNMAIEVLEIAIRYKLDGLKAIVEHYLCSS